jgi:preprotein translocase subunit SecB
LPPPRQHCKRLCLKRGDVRREPDGSDGVGAVSGRQAEIGDFARPATAKKLANKPALFTRFPCVSQARNARAPEISMSTTNGGPQPQMALPQVAVLAQYVKDLSFENPHAPRSMAPSSQQPSINIQINVDAAPVSETDFEVTLRLEGKAEAQSLVLYSFELVFGGMFRIMNVPADSLQPFVLIECPRLLFPFAREIIATAVRNGGFQPLLLNPIDFVDLYRQRLAASQAPPGSQPLNPA